MKTTIYLAHALSNAPEAYRLRMAGLRLAIESLPGAEVLRFAWIDGGGSDMSVKNVFAHDMMQVKKCDLFVGVLDIFSGGVGMELLMRCQRFQPLRVFFPKDSRLSRMVPDCIETERIELKYKGGYSAERLAYLHSEMADPIEYGNDDEIVHVVADWVRAHQERIASSHSAPIPV